MRHLAQAVYLPSYPSCFPTPHHPWAHHQLGDYVNAVLVEDCTASNDTVNNFRALSTKAKASGARFVAQCHFGHPQYVPPLNLTIATDTAAAFLCGAGDDAYFATAGWRAHGPGDADHGNFSTHWLPSIMGRPLGSPLSVATYDSTSGVWSRDFATGTKVRFDAKTNRGCIAWSDDDDASCEREEDKLATHSPPPSPGSLPKFSWDTVPVFWHAASPTPYTAAQIAMLAKYVLSPNE